MDLLSSSSRQLWSLHASFQQDDHQKHQSLHHTTKQQQQQQPPEQPAAFLDDAAGSGGRLFQIAERLDETDADSICEQDDDPDHHNKNNNLHTKYAGPTRIYNNPYLNSPYMGNAEDHSYNSLEQDTDLEEDEDDTDLEEDEQAETAAPHHVLGVFRRRPQENSSMQQQQQQQSERQPVGTESNSSPYRQILLDNNSMDSSSLHSLESELSKEENEPKEGDDDNNQEDEEEIEEFKKNEAQQLETERATVETCFSKVQLVSPQFFDTPDAQPVLPQEEDHGAEDDLSASYLGSHGSSGKKAKNRGTPDRKTTAASPARNSLPPQQHQQQPQLQLSLSSLITPMDPTLFSNDDLTSPPRKAKHANQASSPSSAAGSDASVYLSAAATSSQHEGSPTNVLHLDEYRHRTTTSSTVEQHNHHQNNATAEALAALCASSQSSKLSSSFRSATHQNHRVVYGLSGGKKAMTRQQRLYSKSYLPRASSVVLMQSPPAAETQASTPAAAGSDTTPTGTTTFAPAAGSDATPTGTTTTFAPAAGSDTTPSTTTPKNSNSSRSSRRKQPKEELSSLLFQTDNNDDDDCLSILLVHVVHKVFEIVTVPHVGPETTVGDVLDKARSRATDTLLSSQPYVSLCSAHHELAARMLPVELMIVDMKKKNKKQRKNKTKRNNSSSPIEQSIVISESSSSDPTNQQQPKPALLKQYDDRELKEELAALQSKDPSMGRLLVAVPEGSSAYEVRSIQKALWKHPRVQRWWNKRNRPSNNGVQLELVAL